MCQKRRGCNQTAQLRHITCNIALDKYYLRLIWAYAAHLPVIIAFFSGFVVEKHRAPTEKQPTIAGGISLSTLKLKPVLLGSTRETTVLPVGTPRASVGPLGFSMQWSGAPMWLCSMVTEP